MNKEVEEHTYGTTRPQVFLLQPRVPRERAALHPFGQCVRAECSAPTFLAALEAVCWMRLGEEPTGGVHCLQELPGMDHAWLCPSKWYLCWGWAGFLRGLREGLISGNGSCLCSKITVQAVSCFLLVLIAYITAALGKTLEKSNEKEEISAHSLLTACCLCIQQEAMGWRSSDKEGFGVSPLRCALPELPPSPPGLPWCFWKRCGEIFPRTVQPQGASRHRP